MSKPGFFFWSDYGSTVFLARRLKSEGHPVLVYLKDPAASHVGNGLVPKTTNPVPPRSFPYVIFDGVGHGNVGRQLRASGHRVLGGNPFDKPLESDRVRGAAIMEEIGIRTPEAKPFSSAALAIKFLEKESGEWLVKQIGTDTDEAGTFGPETTDKLIRYIRYAGPKMDKFQLCKKVVGTEISVNGWWNGREFMRPFDATIEEKKFLPGGLGRRTGCESNLVWTLQDEVLPSRTVLPLASQLMAEGYVGPIDLNSLIDISGSPVGLEWTARLGFDATQAWSNLFTSKDLGEQLAGYLDKTLHNWEMSKDWSLTVRCSMPPYPLWEPKIATKYLGTPLDKRWLSEALVTADDVMLTQDGACMAGRDGLIGTVGAIGPDWHKLKAECLEKAKSMHIPNKQYNIEPISRAEKDIQALEKMGVLGRAKS